MRMDDRWCALWSHIDPAVSEPAFGRLSLRYLSQDRAYHNWGHILWCLREFEKVKHLASDRFAVEVALWFHDAVYDSRGKQNEELSADLMDAELRNFSTVRLFRDYVRKLIMATKHDAPVESRDEQLVVDIDLNILGAPRRRYEAYSEAIRTEYSWVPMPDYVKGRAAVLQSFLDRPHIFYTEHYRAACEAAARENMAWEIAKLQRLQ